ncbi:phage tail fiber protein [Enterovirga sp. CN4-39]|uniref:phage tail fiber protein n=1 Tax=Enterovirga sp. CN4-39 TaxID=3400910 RepID=UPI003C04BDF7
MSASNYAENKLVDHLLGTTTFTKPTAVYLGLFTADPGEGATGPEVAGLGYARQAAQFSAANAGTARNTSLIVFPAATGGAWGTITHFGIFDAATGGNLLVKGAFDSSRVIGDTDALLVNANDLAVTLD